MVEILAGMVNLSYGALGAIAVQGADVLDRLFSDKINQCVYGSPENYSEVYCLFIYLFIQKPYQCGF
ncbi:MAG: hypothetical protein PHO08_04930 [Methylococcales bacterium]|nr:hypothetical protein [Methylococcales bacterium]